jgi:RNA polymerase sigma-70 factor (ECF subfamily)
LEKCLEGDRAAQSKLVRHYAKKLLPVCKRYAPDDHLAQDALQETFINTFRYLDKFSGKGSFDAWIRRIAVNCSLTLHKKLNLGIKKLANKQTICFHILIQ